MRYVEKNSVFNIVRNFANSEEDNLLFTLCYSPILKSNVSYFYQCLNSLSVLNFRNNNYLIDDLVSITGLSLSEINTSLMYLEAINLLVTYRKENENCVNYILELVPVASAKKFFTDAVLTTALIKATSHQYFQKVKSLFCKDNFSLDGYTKMNSKFTDFFDISPADITKEKDFVNKSKELLKDKSYVKVYDDLVKNVIFENTLKEHQLNPNIYSIFKQDIVGLVNLYNLPEDVYTSFLKDSTSSDGSFFDINIFKKKIRKYKNTNDIILKEDINYDENEELISEDQNTKILKKIMRMDPENLLRELLRKDDKTNFVLTTSQKEIVEDLKLRYNFSNAIINIILHYCINYKKVFNKKYIDSISTAVHINNLHSAIEVVNFLYENDRSNKSTNLKPVIKFNENEDKVQSNDTDNDQVFDGTIRKIDIDKLLNS